MKKGLRIHPLGTKEIWTVSNHMAILLNHVDQNQTCSSYERKIRAVATKIHPVSEL